MLDLDWLRKSWPAPPGDRFNFGLLLRNLRSAAGNYLDAGAARLVLAGVVERQDERKQPADAVGVDLTVCWLRAELPVIHQRLAQRHADEPEALRWHLDRSAELDAILGRAAVDDFTVDVARRLRALRDEFGPLVRDQRVVELRAQIGLLNTA
ncbi:hypothetical protein [Streptomyces drozdowiczii]|uniref:Uncharacterized protein n=1 Tax=Streptomyces drozdowiczii TaxID=202862 RepID=A0ABY6PW40_9ACTN|nr:hypothetical protein [Streptomyces drozdowiczii]MCX0243536.1 hypothetical protein [Streptomyces drozdowiczii]UZK56555.1 hypothetical protein NEH16_22905 [Streptomyces drozdowiczii]